METWFTKTAKWLDPFPLTQFKPEQLQGLALGAIRVGCLPGEGKLRSDLSSLQSYH